MNDTSARVATGLPRRVSEILELLASTWPHERISLGDIAKMLGDRGYGLLMLVLALPGAVPGISSIAAIPLSLIALQLALGLPRPWLPRMLADRSLSRSDFARMIGGALPHLARVERMLKPRFGVLAGPIGERLMGVVCLILALLLTVPVLVNLPLVVPIVLMALAILERDGLIAAIGLAAGVVVVAGITGLGWISLQEGLQLVGKYLGM